VDTGTAGVDTGLVSLESTVLTAVALPPTSSEPAQHACLVVIFGAEIGRRIALEGTEVVVGRASTADLVLDSDSVSRTHAIVSRTSRGFVLRDQDSTNGTFVNDQPIRERALKDGDQIRIGRAMLKFLTSNNVEAQYHEEIYRLMTLDGLTELYNRRYFQEALERELTRSRRYHNPFVLVLVDIDHFKGINDRWGHQAGDTVLRRVAAAMKSKVRSNDLVARIGGEEFAVLLPETRQAGGVALAEKLRRVVEDERIHHEGNRIPVTISLGVAEFRPEMEHGDALVKEADARLYEAKHAGRNTVR
jgi:two-component system, cell cycle response regulator